MIDMKVKDYCITSDDSQVTVNKVRRDELGNVRTTIDKKTQTKSNSLALVGYYGTLEQALTGIVRDYVGSDAVVIKTISEYKQACDDIVRAYKTEIGLGVKPNEQI